MLRRHPRSLPVALLAAVCLTSGCVPSILGPHKVMRETAQLRNATALCEALEVLIDEGRDRHADREFAYDEVRKYSEETAAYYYALASITGRLVQDRGLLGAPQIREMERAAEKSRAFDPMFQNGAAARLLGTLYVFAPATLLEHGDSESGLDILEDLTEQQPEIMQNHLRLAEAYIALSDPTPAIPHLCLCIANRDKLRPDEQRLVDQLVRTIGPVKCE